MSKSEYTEGGLFNVKDVPEYYFHLLSSPAATVVTEHQLRISKGKRELKENTNSKCVIATVEVCEGVESLPQYKDCKKF